MKKRKKERKDTCQTLSLVSNLSTIAHRFEFSVVDSRICLQVSILLRIIEGGLSNDGGCM